MPYHKYSDEQIAAAIIKLAYNQYNYEMTASDTGVPVGTLKRWNATSVVPKLNISVLLERTIGRLLENMPTQWQGNEWAVAVGILIDKWLLSQGHPTAKGEVFVRKIGGLNENELAAVFSEVESILQEARGGGPPEGGSEIEA